MARILILPSSAVQACPDRRLDLHHYRDDGSCYHFPDKAGNIDRAL